MTIVKTRFNVAIKRASSFTARKLTLLSLTSIIALLDTANSVAIIPAITEMTIIYNWHEIEIAAILSAYFMGALITLLPIGLILDRKYQIREHILLLGFITLSTSAFLFHVSMNFLLGMILARIIMGIANSAMRVSTFAIIAEEFPSHRGFANALVMTFMGLGAVIGFFFGGPAWITFFFWIALTSLPFIFVFIFLIVMSPVKKGITTPKVSFSLVSKILPRWNVLASIGPLSFLTFILGIGITIYPRFTREILKIDPQMTNIAIGVALILFSMMLPVIGYLSDRHGRKPFILASMIGTGILLPLVVGPQDTMIFITGLVVVGSIQSGLMAAADPLLMDTVENELLKLGKEDVDLFGIAGTLRSFAWGLGFIIGPLITGLLITFLSIPLMALFIGISCFAWAFLFHKGAIEWEPALVAS